MKITIFHFPEHFYHMDWSTFLIKNAGLNVEAIYQHIFIGPCHSSERYWRGCFYSNDLQKVLESIENACISCPDNAQALLETSEYLSGGPIVFEWWKK